MHAESTPHKLLDLLFGEAAPAALRTASPRLLRWSQAFDVWLVERGERVALQAWRRLLQGRRKMPWELSQTDIEDHAAWMLEKAYSPARINNDIRLLAAFYRWCSQHAIDDQCSADFNPAAGVRRYKERRYSRLALLSQGEIDALLDILRRDDTPLGRRNYAFFLARLRLGVPLKPLQRWQWGQIEHEHGAAWVRWKAGGERLPLPGDVWDAIQAYLHASGRLPAMQPESYLFAPLADPLHEGQHDQPQAWAEGRVMSAFQATRSLRGYARRLGIPDERLTLSGLRMAAIRLRLDEGYTLKQIRGFMHSTEPPWSTKYRLRQLPPLPVESPQAGERPATPSPPPHKPHRYRREEMLVHGMFARSQPPEAVAAVLAQDIHGIDEELAGLRSLARRLLEPEIAARKGADPARLADAYTQAASRLALMIDAEKKLRGDKEVSLSTEKQLQLYDQLALQRGGEPVSEQIRLQALGGDTRLGLTDRRLKEEIAATRYALRTTLAFAEGELNTAAYIRLVEVYGRGCLRLMRLMRLERGENDRLAEYLHRMFVLATRRVLLETGYMTEEQLGPPPPEWE